MGIMTGALAVISEAAEAGNGMALNILGAANDEGRERSKKTRFKAVDLLEQAAKAGEVRACYNLGSIFALGSRRGRDGSKTSRSRVQGRRWFGLRDLRRQRLANWPKAPIHVDHGSAADWYEKGHEAGDVVGTTNLAHAYVKGRGRSVSWVRARVLHTEAAARGYSSRLQRLRRDA